jgi:saccharopine dehydrogenase-like NADP-dependent oxidoreductase
MCLRISIALPSPCAHWYLGSFGLIGLCVVRTLCAAGHAVTEAGRSARTGERLYPTISWISAQLASLLNVAEWKPLLEDTDVVVNAAQSDSRLVQSAD